jgi:DNA repair protein RecO (recombination protein O)
MPSVKDVAIVLRVVPFSETSYVVTLFTRGQGKISALAKGARRRKSPFESALDLLAICHIVFIHKSSQALDLLTEAKLERRFRAGSHDLARLYAGYYVAELVSELTTSGDPHPELFDQAIRTLQSLDHGGDVARLVLRFELVALRWLGHLPSLDTCAECGVAVTIERRVAFGELLGGILCSRCKAGKRQVISASGEVIQLMRQFADVTSDAWERTDLAGHAKGELRGLLNHYLCHVIGRRPRMHAYLGAFSQ